MVFDTIFSPFLGEKKSKRPAKLSQYGGGTLECKMIEWKNHVIIFN